MTRYEIPDEPPETGWDIHCHTVFSDGTETPQGMVSLALRNGLDGIAITDHDTSAGWDDAADAAAREGIALLRGTEITAVCGSVSVHMLGLQYDPANKRIADMFSTTRRKRLLRTRHMVERMAQDFPITWQKVEQQVKPHHGGQASYRGRAGCGRRVPDAKRGVRRGGERAIEVLHSHAVANGTGGGGDRQTGWRRDYHRASWR